MRWFVVKACSFYNEERFHLLCNIFLQMQYVHRGSLVVIICIVRQNQGRRVVTVQNPLGRILEAQASALEREAGDYTESAGICRF